MNEWEGLVPDLRDLTVLKREECGTCHRGGREPGESEWWDGVAYGGRVIASWTLKTRRDLKGHLVHVPAHAQIPSASAYTPRMGSSLQFEAAAPVIAWFFHGNVSLVLSLGLPPSSILGWFQLCPLVNPCPPRTTFQSVSHDDATAWIWRLFSCPP